MKRTSIMTDLALVAVFAALIAAVSMWVPGITVAGSSVPITLQTLAVTIAAMVLGPWRGFLATLLWLVVGLFGLPVFSGGASGFGVLARPSAGFLIAFPIFALVCGWLSHLAVRRLMRRDGSSTAALLAALIAIAIACEAVITYPLGIWGMMHTMHIGFSKAWKFNVPFFPGDLIKIVLSSIVAIAVHKAFPVLALGGRPAATRDARTVRA